MFLNPAKKYKYKTKTVRPMKIKKKDFRIDKYLIADKLPITLPITVLNLNGLLYRYAYNYVFLYFNNLTRPIFDFNM